MLDKKELGQKIKDLRLSLNLGQKELAAKLGYTPQMISAIECGTCSMASDKLRAMADALQVDITYLLGENFPFGDPYEDDARKYTQQPQKPVETQKRADSVQDMDKILRAYTLYMSLSRQERQTFQQMARTTEDAIKRGDDM